MRRLAVTTVLLLAGAGCTERLVLPSAASGGGGITGNPGGGGGRMSSDGGRSGGGGGAAGSPNNCQKTLVKSMAQKADLLLMVGRDQSMSSRFIDDSTNPAIPTPTTRMLAVQNALEDLIPLYQNAVNFGYLEYPALGSGSCSSNSGCCADGTIVEPNSVTFGLIDNRLHACGGAPAADGCVSSADVRPIADAFKNVSNEFSSLGPSNGEQYAVLIVDGAPSCALEDPSTSCANAKGQMGLQPLLHNNINVSIVTVGQDAEQVMCLQDIAENSGSTMKPFAYQARDSSQLIGSLTSIISNAARGDCTIDILSNVPDLSKVSVTAADQTTIPKDTSGQNGWKFIGGGSSIQVNGTYCQLVQQTKASDVHVWFGCAP